MTGTLCMLSSEVLSNEIIINNRLDAYMPVLSTLPVYSGNATE